MRRFLTLLMSILLMVAFAAPVLAATEPIITQQPQNPTFGKYGTATYSVTVYGDNLQCNWYLHFNGVDYNISSAGDGTQPWEAYAGDSYGPEQTVDGEATVFRYNFYGIGEELSGCYIYAVIEDGHFEVISDKAYINVVEGADRPPNTIVPTAIEACKGDIVDIYCSAFAVDGSELTYLWYETATGELMDIVAVNRGSEDGDTLRVDTGSYGTRYYVCAVSAANGGSTYTSVIPVTILEAQAIGEPPEITTQSLKDATVGESYSVKLECTDPDAAFDISYNPGKDNEFDKTGLNLTQHGEIEGIPTVAGTYTFTVCASGENGEGYMTYTLTVKAPVVEATEPVAAETEAPTEAETEAPTVEATEPVKVPVDEEEDTEKDETEEAPEDENEDVEVIRKGMPWWGIVLIAVGAAGIGIGGTVFVIWKKK